MKIDMSRYNIPAFDQRYKIIVGWDWASRTYFAQVLDIDAIEHEDRFRVWIGTLLISTEN